MISLISSLLLTACIPGGSPAAALEERGGLRPALSGPEETATSEDGVFTIHWTEEGEDRPGQYSDLDGNGLPDAIDRILVGLTTAAAAYEDSGYRTVNSDGGGGDSAGIDVYVREIDAFGYAIPIDGTFGTSCYMELDPHLDGLGAGVAESVAAHELHHCVQYAYTTATHSWIYEATATYEQYLLFEGPALDGGLALLWNQRLGGADRKLSALGDRFEYSGFVFLKFWSEFGGGDHSRVVDLWEQLSETSVWREAVDLQSTEQWDQPFEDTFADLSLWKFFACRRDDGGHFDTETHPCVLPGISVDVVGLEPDASQVDFVFDDGPYAAKFTELSAPSDSLVLVADCAVEPEGARGGLSLVSVDSYGVRGEEARSHADGGGDLTVRLGPGLDTQGTVGLVALSADSIPALLTCGLRWEDPPPPEGAASECSCSSTPSHTPGLAFGLLALGLVLRARLRGRSRTSPGSVAC